MSKLPEATPEQRETLHQKAIGKHKETKVEYEIFLRHGDEAGEFFVDVRKDIVDSDGDVVNGVSISKERFLMITTKQERGSCSS